MDDREIISTMQALADDGWCVVLKRLPASVGWLLQGARSEYDEPCEDATVGEGKWAAEASDMRIAGGYRVSAFALDENPIQAIRNVKVQCDEATARVAAALSQKAGDA